MWHTSPPWPPIGMTPVALLYPTVGRTGNHVSTRVIVFLAKTSGDFVSERENGS